MCIDKPFTVKLEIPEEVCCPRCGEMVQICPENGYDADLLKKSLENLENHEFIKVLRLMSNVIGPLEFQDERTEEEDEALDALFFMLEDLPIVVDEWFATLCRTCQEEDAWEEAQERKAEAKMERMLED